MVKQVAHGKPVGTEPPSQIADAGGQEAETDRSHGCTRCHTLLPQVWHEMEAHTRGANPERQRRDEH